MPFFLVKMEHPDEAGWRRHRDAHGAYLRALVDNGSLRASGPITDMGVKAGFLILQAQDRDVVRTIIDADPFAIAGIVENLTINEWGPLFGAFAAESSGQPPA